MPDYNGLLNVMKQAGTEAVDAGCPLTVCFGKVLSVSPIQVLVEQKMTLGAAQLVLTRNVTDYEIPVTVEWKTESTELHVHGLIGKEKMIVHNSLTQGEEVVLLRQQGGQKYIIIDRVG